MDADKGDKGGADQNLIGQWVHEHPEICDQFSLARDFSIEVVGEAGRAEEKERDRFMEAALRENDCEERNR